MSLFRLWFKGFCIAGLFLLGMLTVSTLMPLLRGCCGRRADLYCGAIVRNWHRLVCRILNLHLHVSGSLPQKAGLLVANHISWLDIIAIGAQSPCLFVAKEEIAAWPVIGRLARGIGTLFIRRGDAAQTATACETMTWLLRRGSLMVLFPEGTTTSGHQVQRFHGKLFQPAQLAGVTIQAIALRYQGEAADPAPFIGNDAFLCHLLRILQLKRIDLDLHYCSPLPNGLRRDQLARAARLQILESLDSGRARLLSQSIITCHPKVTVCSPSLHQKPVI
ncbi:MAG: lysophospholipid acyltransferase family protein [Methylococcaceae bacterium]|jgi:1-acyl-sn-glycerol-3-phosphate acyltransferase